MAIVFCALLASQKARSILTRSMPTITYTADGFPSAYGNALAGTFSINVSWGEIVWAAISVGKSQLAHVAQYGVFSIYANLWESPSGSLRRSLAVPLTYSEG